LELSRKYKLLKLNIISLIIDFLFAGLNRNITNHKKAPKNGRFIDGALKTKGIIYFHAETWMLFALRYQNVCILHRHL